MKKIIVIICAVFLNLGLFSCTPQSLTDEVTPQACCGDDDPILPPPPPPPPPSDKIDG